MDKQQQTCQFIKIRLNTMENGLVLIVMPCYNAENFIKESINNECFYGI